MKQQGIITTYVLSKCMAMAARTKPADHCQCFIKNVKAALYAVPGQSA